MTKHSYKYGMRLRGYSPGAQPKTGFLARLDSPSDKYYDIIVYERELTVDEVHHYDLDYLGAKLEVE